MTTSFEHALRLGDPLDHVSSPEKEPEHAPNPYLYWDLPYVATPLNADQLRIEDQETGDLISYYMSFAFDQVDARLKEALASPPDRLDQNEALWPVIKKMLQAGVYGELFGRIAANTHNEIANLLQAGDERSHQLVGLASGGNAVPTELIELLMRNPAIGKLEVAKQTSPLDWKAMRAVNTMIDMTMADVGFTFLSPDEQAIDYSVMRFDYTQEPRLALMVRQGDVGRLVDASGTFHVAQRDVFVTDLTQADTETSQELAAWMKDAAVQTQFKGGQEVMYRGGRWLPRFIEGQSQLYDGHVGAIMPAVRSYSVRHSE